MSRLQPHRSLRHEYELFVEREIEAYKESVSRSVLLSIGDEAVAALAAEQQFALTELILWEEVDRIIMRRIGLPTFQTWRRRRLRRLAAYRRPEHWGFAPDAPIVRTAEALRESHVLVSGVPSEASALFLAANGCEVTTVETDEEAVERVRHVIVEEEPLSFPHGVTLALANCA